MTRKQKVGLVKVSDLTPCPENDAIYGAPSLDDPDIRALIASIKERGVNEPLRVSTDHVIISGHRRRFCAIEAGLAEVPIIVEPVSYAKGRERFMALLVHANEQRKKSAGVLIREAALRIDPAQAVQAMRTERKARDHLLLYGDGSGNDAELSGGRQRNPISEASMPFLRAALMIATAHRAFWPLSVRQIHYRLLNDPPLKFTAKGKVGLANAERRRYANDKSSYNSLVNLLARARGRSVPMGCHR